MAKINTRGKYYKKMTSYRAVGLAEGFEEVSAKTDSGKKEEILSAWQYLVDTGMVWSLQGFFGRTAKELLDKKLLKPAKNKKTKTQ